MDPGARFAGQDDIARHHDVLGARRDASKAQAHALDPLVDVPSGTQVEILAVIDHRHAERCGVFHGPPHQAGIHHRQAVVADRDGALAAHGSNIGQPLALAALRDRPDRMHVDCRGAASALHDEAGHLRGIVHGLCVGHAAHGGESARRRGAGAALDGFGVFNARLAQMHVDVDEAGCDDQSGGIVDSCAGALDGGLDRGDPLVIEQHVALGVETAGRVHDAAVLQQQAHAFSRPIGGRPIPTPPSGWQRRSRLGSGSSTAGSRRPRWRFRGPG